MNSVYLLLGGNIGNIAFNFEKAKELIGKHIGFISDRSPVYCTEPWGFESKNMFYNQAVLVETKLTPGNVLSSILFIESKLGRKRKKNVMDRIIDIDILFYNDQVINEKDLDIPHPRMHLRKFMLVPMSDINPQLKHPVFGKTISQLIEACNDDNAVFPCQINNQRR